MGDQELIKDNSAGVISFFAFHVLNSLNIDLSNLSWLHLLTLHALICLPGLLPTKML
jgi:hypothetical protein